MSTVKALSLLLGLIGEPVLAVGAHGACGGEVVSAGVVVFDGCALDTFAASDMAVYVEPSEEPLTGWTVVRGRAAGRIILYFDAAQLR